MNTSLPEFGPFWNTALSGMWRRPMSTPGCDVGISAQVMPRSSRVADEMVGVVGAEREAEQRRDRAERDVALVPRDAQAEHALALVLAPADDAVVGNRRRVRARVRIGEREARDLEALARGAAGSGASARRCRSAAGARRARANSAPSPSPPPCRECVDSLVITCECAYAEKPRPPYSFGMIIPRKPLVLDELPHARRQVAVDVASSPSR